MPKPDHCAASNWSRRFQSGMKQSAGINTWQVRQCLKTATMSLLFHLAVHVPKRDALRQLFPVNQPSGGWNALPAEPQQVASLKACVVSQA